jgi:hypothetical protein
MGMNRSGIPALVLIGILLGGALVVWAQGPFTAGELDRFIDDWPGFASMLESQGQALEAEQISSLAQGLQLNQKVQSYLSGRGWTPDRFMYMASHVSAGLFSQIMAQKQPEIQAGMAQAKAEIMNNPDIPAEMKQQLLAQMEAGLAQTQQMGKPMAELPQQELDLIAARLERIKAAFQVDE